MVTIYKYDGTKLVQFEAYPSGSKYYRKLMEQDYIQIEFSLQTPVFFPIGSYINTDFGKFVITEEQMPSYIESTGVYRYSLQFEMYYYSLKNRIFKFLPEDGNAEASWSLTATLSTHMDVYLRNLQALGFKSTTGSNFTYSIDSTVSVESHYLTYSNTSLIDALTSMAEEWDCEWWIDGSVIHFGKCESTLQDNDVVLQLISPADVVQVEGNTPNTSENVGELTIWDGSVSNGTLEMALNGAETNSGKLIVDYNISAISTSKSSGKFYNRLYVFGSTKNIPSTYRQADGTSTGTTIAGVADKRLMLPLSYNEGKNYIDAETGLNESQIVEGVYVNDDIFPERTGEIGTVTYYDKETTDEESGAKITKRYYRFTDADSTFHFSKSYILSGQTLKATFQSGALNGMEFEITFNPNGEAEKDSSEAWRSEAQLYEIVMNSDYGLELPAGTLIPASGDEYVLTGFDISLVSDSYVSAAEQRLLADAQAYMEKTKIDSNNYTCTLFADYAHDRDLVSGVHGLAYQLGNVVTLQNNAYFASGKRTSRIMGWELDLQQPYKGSKFIVGDKASYSRLGELEANVEDAKNLAKVIKIPKTDFSKYKFLLETFAKESQHTYIEGGLILSSLLELGYGEDSSRVTLAGLNGIYDDSVAGGGISAWFGGDMIDRENSITTANAATSLFRFDGSGYVAEGQISWGYDSDGNLYLNIGDKANLSNAVIEAIAKSITINADNIDFNATKEINITSDLIKIAAKTILIDEKTLPNYISQFYNGSEITGKIAGGIDGVLECANGAKITWNGGILTSVTGFDS